MPLYICVMVRLDYISLKCVNTTTYSTVHSIPDSTFIVSTSTELRFIHNIELFLQYRKSFPRVVGKVGLPKIKSPLLEYVHDILQLFRIGDDFF